MKDKVGVNQIGWDAIWHKDGWWVGTDKGVTCYADHELARAALTIHWGQQTGGGAHATKVSRTGNEGLRKETMNILLNPATLALILFLIIAIVLLYPHRRNK